MTTLFGKKTGYYMKDIPIESTKNEENTKNKGYKFAILYYGNILDSPGTWKTLKVPISSIKALLPTSGNWKIEVVWNDDEEYNIDMFNKIEFE